VTAPGAVVVGTGFGVRVHVPALRAAGFEVNAVVGRDQERTRRRADRAGIPHACRSLADALALGGIAAVTIASPPATHHDLAVEACRAGVAVLCEKPFALDAAQASAMVAAAERAGVPGLVGHEFRWAPERAAVGRALGAGAIGEPRLAAFISTVGLVADPGARMPPWWFDRAGGGGWLLASGSHAVDQVRTWLGEFDTVAAALATVSDRPAGDAEDSFSIRFRLVNGVEGVLQQSGGAWGPALGLAHVAGTAGSIGIDDDGPWIADPEGRRPLPIDADLALPVVAPSQRPEERYTHLELGPYTQLCRALFDLVESGAAHAAVAVPTFADGLAHMEVLDAVRASVASGGGAAVVRRAGPGQDQARP
jgi:predicted dehydrogenase